MWGWGGLAHRRRYFKTSAHFLCLPIISFIIFHKFSITLVYFVPSLVKIGLLVLKMKTYTVLIRADNVLKHLGVQKVFKMWSEKFIWAFMFWENVFVVKRHFIMIKCIIPTTKKPSEFHSTWLFTYQRNVSTVSHL